MRLEKLLHEAAEVLKQRGEAYGDPLTCFATIAELWTAIGLGRNGRAITPRDVTLAMILLKVARQSHRWSHDGAVDIAGYATCGDALEN